MNFLLKPQLVVSVVALVFSIPQAVSAEPHRLSLGDALRIALENNFDLVSARKDPRIAEERIDFNQASFDGVIGANADIRDSSSDSTVDATSTFTNLTTGTTVTAQGTTDGSSDTEDLSGQVSWNQLLYFGGQYSVSVGVTDADNSSRGIEAATGSLQNNTSAVTSDGLTLRYEMPLLKGLGVETNMEGVLLARSGLEISNEDLRLEAILTVKEVEDAYWDLLATRAALDVARESLTLARDLYNLNKKKVEVGTLAPIEVTQAESGVATREEGVIVAETLVANAEDELRRLLAIPRDDPLWTTSIEPVDQPAFEERPVDLEAALASAMVNRPEIAVARQQVLDSELSERVARNQTRHSLDLAAEWTTFTSDADRLTERFSPLSTEVNDSNTDADGSNWSVGLVYSYPLRNRRAKANYAIARLNREKSEVALRSAEQDILVDVRVAARNVESGIKRVAAARAATRLQRKTLEAEQKKFENGLSTSFEVLRIQTDLSDARLAEIRAILDYTKSLADLERAKGTLLEARGFSVSGTID